MKLLILTQKIDINDDILGFFHEWVKKFAEQFKQVTVICLQKNEYNLPNNVKIVSLGKKNFEFEIAPPAMTSSGEVGRENLEFLKKLKYGFRFLKYIWLERKNYDAVFVHMNPIYLVLAGWFWKLWGKKIILWYIHPRTDLKLKIGCIFTDKILSAAEQTFPIKSKKLIITGHGINTEIFKKIPAYKPKNSMLYVGRISPVKNLEEIVAGTKSLHYHSIDFMLTFAGGPDKQFVDYYETIKKDMEHLMAIGNVTFLGQLPNEKLPEIYNKNEILINLTDSGSFDKAILEAMACECLILVSNKVFNKILPEEFIVEKNNPEEIQNKLLWIFNLSQEAKEKYGKNFRQYILENHNLDNLIKKIKNIYNNI